MDDAAEVEADEIFKAIGELIVWANMIDHQMNSVLIGTFALPKHVFTEPVIAQFDLRQKAEMIKTRLKFLPDNNVWRNNVSAWVKRAEKVNENRNIVAHHRIQFEGDKVYLITSQLNKLLKSIDRTMKPKPGKGVPEVKRWGQEAAAVYQDGDVIVANLKEFRDMVLKKHGTKLAEEAKL